MTMLLHDTIMTDYYIGLEARELGSVTISYDTCRGYDTEFNWLIISGHG